MPEQSLLVDIAVIFLTALVGGMVAEMLRQSPLVGYIIGGIAAGPYVAGLVKNVETVSAFAEIGVILLMFTLGVEFSVSRLSSVKRIALIGGIGQIIIQILLAVLLHKIMGLGIYQAVFIGCVVSISSTMIVLRVLGELGQLNAAHSQVMLGILVVQDLAVVVMVSLLPQMDSLSLAQLPSFLGAFVLSLAFVLLTAFLAQRVVPLVMDIAAKGSNEDIFLILALSLGLGIAILAQLMGTSLALGAFLAGLLVSDSDYAHELLGKVTALKDAFVILFFVSVGMMIDPRHLLTDLRLLIIVLLLIMPVKFIIFFLLAKLLRYNSRIAFYVGVGMMQTGEFSFVMARMGLDSGIISLSVYNVILASSLLTILLTPPLIRTAPYGYDFLKRLRICRLLFGEEVKTCEAFSAGLSNHIILCGYGRVGRQVGEALQFLNVPHVVAEYDYNAIRQLGRKNVPYVYGDVANEEVLKELSPQKAKLAVIALPDAVINERVTKMLLKYNSELKIITRAHTVWEKDLLFTAGALEVVQPEEEAGLTMVRHIIPHLELPQESVLDYLESQYIKGYSDIITARAVEAGPAEQFRVRSFKIPSGSRLIGLPLRESGIRENTGCSVVAIRRASSEIIINPHSKERIEADDTLSVMGSSSQLLSFVRCYLGGKEDV